MYKITYTNRFQKDVRRCQKRGLEIGLLQKAVKLLEQTGTLPVEYRPHKLKGNRKNQWECHIEPDWLMTWEQDDTKLTLLFIQTGTHSDLFG